MRADAAARRFEALRAELPAGSPQALRFAALRGLSRAGGLVSEGLRIGYRHGFDSGPFMAHVYADRPRGRTALGRRVDRGLLSRPTAQAFRDIRRLAQEAVLEAIDAHPTAAPVVADLAAGPSPYLLRALALRPEVTAVLCDIDPVALEQAREAAQASGVAGRVVIRSASAFDRAALEAFAPRPDIVCELGLYGIYHDDRLVERHFADLAETLAPSQIVCNVQVDNPEIEHIARVWVNARGERCVWRLRPAEVIEGWARAAGYELAATTADRHSIYRVMRFTRAGALGVGT